MHQSSCGNGVQYGEWWFSVQIGELFGLWNVLMIFTVNCLSSIRFFCSSHFKYIFIKFKPTQYSLRHASSFVQFLYVFLCEIIRQTITLFNARSSIYWSENGNAENSPLVRMGLTISPLGRMEVTPVISLDSTRCLPFWISTNLSFSRYND